MSRRAEHRRQARARAAAGDPRALPFGPNDDVALVPGWCALTEDLEYTRQATHDTLIDLLGNRRASGITWYTFAGDEAQRACADLLDGDRRPDWVRHITQIKHLLDAEGGHLVIATAKGLRR